MSFYPDWSPEEQQPSPYQPPPIQFDPTQQLTNERAPSFANQSRMGDWLDNLALSLQNAPLQAPNNFGGGLASGLANGFAITRGKNLADRQMQQQSERKFAADRNAANLKATEAARALRMHALQKKADLADQTKAQVDAALGTYAGKQEMDRRARVGDFKPAAPKEAPGVKPPDMNDYTSLLTKVQNDNDLQKFQIVRDSYATMREAATGAPSAQKDISIIYSFMRINDPGSTVREGEYATAQNSGGVPDYIRNQYNRALNGERLNEKQRASFLGVSQGIYRSRLPQYNRAVTQYRTLASKFGLDPDLIMRDLTTNDPDPSSSTGGADSEYNRFMKDVGGLR